MLSTCMRSPAVRRVHTFRGLTLLRMGVMSFEASLVVNIKRTPADIPPPPLPPPPPPTPEKTPPAAASIVENKTDWLFAGTLSCFIWNGCSEVWRNEEMDKARKTARVFGTWIALDLIWSMRQRGAPTFGF